MADPIISYFGEYPTTMVMQTSSGFNGTAQTALPVITAAVYTFPAQAGGGLYAFHDNTVRVSAVTFKGTGTLTIKKTVGAQDATLGSVTNGEGAYTTSIIVSPGESLKFFSTGAGVVTVTASLTQSSWLG